MTIGIDPLVDFACKKILGSPEHPAVTLHFLNSVLGGSPRITDVEILNPIVEKEFGDDKYSIFDVRARNSEGERFNIEIQRSKPAALPERLTYYAACQLVEQIGAGQGYEDLRPSICVCLLNAILFGEVDDVHCDFRLRTTVHNLTLTDHLQIHLLELPKYRLPSDNQVITEPIEQWCYFFRRAETSTFEELTARLPDPVFIEATGVLKMIARDPDQRRLYEARLKFERDAQAHEDQARQDGMVKGEEIGKVKGEEIGKIKLLRELLSKDSPTDGELGSLSVDQLTRIGQDLRRQLRERG